METSVIPGAKSIQPAQIKDGLSNTAMVVETNPAKAVEWYKPDDFVPDEKDAAAGLRGAWNGGFHVGLADGSVRFVSESIDPVMLRRLFERADGKLFDFGDLERDRNGGVRATLPDREATEDSRAPQEK